jgi:hypothetical protein
VVLSDDPVARVLLLGRLSLYGERASRLHDEVLAVAARWVDASVRAVRSGSHRVRRHVGWFGADDERREFVPLCDTSLGKVAFWGNERDTRNIDRVRGLRTPASLRCGCIPSNWLQFARWIPQGAEVEILASGLEVAGGAVPAAASVAAPVVTADELSAWRRRLLRILDTLEDSAARSEGAIARITSLKKQGRIPRETAAMMIALTELRNVSEHEGRVASEAESAVARNAWLAIRSWASQQGFNVDCL